MSRKDWFTVVGLLLALSTAVGGSVAWVEGRLDAYVRKDTMTAYMQQVLARLASIEEALRK